MRSSIFSTLALSSKNTDVAQNRAHDIGRACAYCRIIFSLRSASGVASPSRRDRQASQRRPCCRKNSKSCSPITRAVQITMVAPFLSASRHCAASGSRVSRMMFARVLLRTHAARSSEPSGRVI